MRVLYVALLLIFSGVHLAEARRHLREHNGTISCSSVRGNSTVTWKYRSDGKKEYEALCVTQGSTITFEFSSGHNVDKLPDEAAYDGCDTTNRNFEESPKVYTMSSLKTYYFACGIYSHCEIGGMRIKIHVVPEHKEAVMTTEETMTNQTDVITTTPLTTQKPMMKIKVRPDCPACPRAKCVSDYCPNCWDPLFKLGRKRYVDCGRVECDNPEDCKVDPCSFVKKPNKGQCISNNCGGCKAVCYNKKCRKVKCKKLKMKTTPTMP
ncbi:unnamed protein product [Owenia fusiformis]|uniref:Phytocyanin domain-containing protein n=1 Tax=Owenia fusiformis TaxID=6347 RepID=A0A8S4Q0T8_OWEFU|nr:unnamed protein product [Owenia fusiformis]